MEHNNTLDSQRNIDHTLKLTFDESYLEKHLMDIISNINFKGDWSIRSIKEQLKIVIGQTPEVEINYEQDALLNEDTFEAYEAVVPKQISIYFTNTDNKIIKKSYLI